MKHAITLTLVVAALAVAGCAGKGLLGNTVEARGSPPKDPDSAVKQHLHATLKDPYSVQDLTIESSRVGYCSIGIYGRYHGWIVPVRYNAKNSYGAYTGLRQYYFWFNGDSLRGVTQNPDVCLDAGSWGR